MEMTGVLHPDQAISVRETGYLTGCEIFIPNSEGLVRIEGGRSP